ncbi:hypothetical protein IWQ55_000277 [Labrenzia sp. EL_208]|nr:hypothetical protein [Labrenzia sp. EL_132]MBG6227085.1 hypothetical protein [Labrenzia sp. EL_208]
MTMQTNIKPVELIGARVVDHYGNEGFIFDVRDVDTPVSVIGAGGLEPVLHEYSVCWEKGKGSYTTMIRDQIARPMLERGEALDPVSNPADRSQRVAHARQCMQVETQRREAEKTAQQKRLEEFREECKRRVPSWAKAAIVAELIEDKSDTMSDYYGGSTRKTVILGFSKHTRDLFPEMRKHARNYSETAHLADASDTAEHREKYSMGGGFYLKEGFRYSDGWKVSKHCFYGDREPWESVPFAEEWAVEAPAAKPMPVSSGVEGVRIEEHTHTRKGFQMFICIMPERVDRAEFDRLRDAAKALRGWYSRPWGKTPGGFAFKYRDNAKTFARGEVSNTGESDTPPARNSALVDRFRDMANKLQVEIDGRFASRRTNTPRQQRQAASAANEGLHLERTQAALRALADAHEAGAVPEVLAGLSSKKDVHALCRARIDSTGAYYDAGVDTGNPATDNEQTRALWALIPGTGAQRQQAEELRRTIDALRLAKIPGYFPTPAPMVARMIEHARLAPGQSILEPSAGSGAIADGVREVEPSAKLTLFEIWQSLKDVLSLKGYRVAGGDFTEVTPAPLHDRVLMNPPFEKGQDMDHVRHAFKALKPGGRLVAIMGPGFTFRQDQKSNSFRGWFDHNGGEIVERFEPGSFKESGTDIATVLVVIDKEPGQ